LYRRMWFVTPLTCGKYMSAKNPMRMRRPVVGGNGGACVRIHSARVVEPLITHP
jgi:hypothetical protein